MQQPSADAPKATASRAQTAAEEARTRERAAQARRLRTDLGHVTVHEQQERARDDAATKDLREQTAIIGGIQRMKMALAEDGKLALRQKEEYEMRRGVSQTLNHSRMSKQAGEHAKEAMRAQSEAWVPSGVSPLELIEQGPSLGLVSGWTGAGSRETRAYVSRLRENDPNMLSSVGVARSAQLVAATRLEGMMDQWGALGPGAASLADIVDEFPGTAPHDQLRRQVEAFARQRGAAFEDHEPGPPPRSEVAFTAVHMGEGGGHYAGRRYTVQAEAEAEAAPRPQPPAHLPPQLPIAPPPPDLAALTAAQALQDPQWANMLLSQKLSILCRHHAGEGAFGACGACWAAVGAAGACAACARAAAELQAPLPPSDPASPRLDRLTRPGLPFRDACFQGCAAVVQSPAVAGVVEGAARQAHCVLDVLRGEVSETADAAETLNQFEGAPSMQESPVVMRSKWRRPGDPPLPPRWWSLQRLHATLRPLAQEVAGKSAMYAVLFVFVLAMTVLYNSVPML